MKSIITNYRYWVLNLLSFIVVIGLVVTPQGDAGFLAYVAIAIGSKLAALAAGVAFWLLYSHWYDNGTIPEMFHQADEE